MSYCKNKRLIISEQERMSILSLYGLINEDENPDGSFTIKSTHFFGDGLWKNLSKESEKFWADELKKLKDFLFKNKRKIAYIKITAGESQVPNRDNERGSDKFGQDVEPGYLSQKRAETMKTLLSRAFDEFKQESIISYIPLFYTPEYKFGQTKYESAKDKVTFKKEYEQERFVKAEIIMEPQSKCIVGLGIEVIYSNDKSDKKFPCRGNHRCNEAIFNVKLNGVVIGRANLNNGNDGGYRTSNILKITDDLAKQIVGNEPKNLMLSLQCTSANCHSSTPEVKITKGEKVIYHQCAAPLAKRASTDDVPILELDPCGEVLVKEGPKENIVTTKEPPPKQSKNYDLKKGQFGPTILQPDQNWFDLAKNKLEKYIESGEITFRGTYKNSNDRLYDVKKDLSLKIGSQNYQLSIGDTLTLKYSN